MRYLTINGYHVIALFQVFIILPNRPRVWTRGERCSRGAYRRETVAPNPCAEQGSVHCIRCGICVGVRFLPARFDRKGFGHIMTFMMNCVVGNLWLQKLFRIITMEIG